MKTGVHPPPSFRFYS